MSLMGFLGQLLLGAVVLGAAVYAPGRLVFLTCRIPADRLEQEVGSMVLGTALFTLVQFVLGYAGWLGGLWVVVGLGIAGVALRWMFWPQDEKPLPSLTGAAGILALIVILGAGLQGSLHFFSGWEGPNGAAYHAFHGHDAPWHVYNIEQFSLRFPAQMPGFAGEDLRNYHFLSDLFWGGIKRLAPVLDAQHLYFRIAPVYYSVLMSLCMFIAARRISGCVATGLWAAALNVFTAGWGYVMPWLAGQPYVLWESIFWLSPPFSLLFNPGVAASLVLVLAGLWGYTVWLRTRVPGVLVFISLVWGVVIGFKVYAGLVIAAGLLAAGLWQGLRQRNLAPFLALGAMLPVSLAVFLPVNSTSAGLVKLLPGYALAAMVAAPDRMNLMSFDTLKAMMLERPVILAGLFIVLALVFVVGNLGVKAMGLVPMVQALLKPRQADPALVFVAFAGAASLAAPLLLVQYGVQWQTIQFGYYAVLLASIPGAMVMQRIARTGPQPRATVIAAVLFMLGTPCVVQSSLVMRWPHRVDKDELAAWRFLREQTPAQAVVLRPLIPSLQTQSGQAQLQRIIDHGKQVSINDFQRSARQSQAAHASQPQPRPAAEPPSSQPMREMNAAYLAGWARRNTFLEDVVSAQIMGYPVEQRLQAVGEIFQTEDPKRVRDFLLRHGIQYVVLFAGDSLRIQPEAADLIRVFANAHVTIYSVRP